MRPQGDGQGGRQLVAAPRRVWGEVAIAPQRGHGLRGCSAATPAAGRSPAVSRNTRIERKAGQFWEVDLFGCF